MKKVDVIDKQKCGIKWYKHVESFVGVDKIIEKTISISKQFPNIWVVINYNNRWDNVHWAFHNAFMEFYEDDKCNIPRFRNNGQSSFNLDEVLTDEQINYIKNKLNISEPYQDSWDRD